MNNLVPEDLEGQQKLSENIDRVVSLLHEIDTLKNDIKEIAEESEDCLSIKKSAFVKLAKAKYKMDAKKSREEAEAIEEALDTLFT